MPAQFRISIYNKGVEMILGQFFYSIHLHISSSVRVPWPGVTLTKKIERESQKEGTTVLCCVNHIEKRKHMPGPSGFYGGIVKYSPQRESTQTKSFGPE